MFLIRFILLFAPHLSGNSVQFYEHSPQLLNKCLLSIASYELIV